MREAEASGYKLINRTFRIMILFGNRIKFLLICKYTNGSVWYFPCQKSLRTLLWFKYKRKKITF